MDRITRKSEVRSGQRERARWLLPALGLVAAAVSGYGSEGSAPSGSAASKVWPPLTVETIAEEATLLHYARAQGVGDGLREDGALFPQDLERQMTEVSEIVASARSPDTAYQIDMAYSTGLLDARDGGWSVAALKAYVTTIDFAGIGVREIADQATLRWEPQIGIDLARETVMQALAVTLAGGSEVSDVSETAGTRGLAVLADVSGQLRPLLDRLNETAFGPSTESLSAASCDTALDGTDTSTPEI